MLRNLTVLVTIEIDRIKPLSDLNMFLVNASQNINDLQSKDVYLTLTTSF